MNDFKDLSNILEAQGFRPEPSVAAIEVGDPEISGGRKIVELKDNQLFTGRFEETDIDEFLRIWRTYRNNALPQLKSQLLQMCRQMILNYRGEVCPVEAMLYTSNIISSSFSNARLVNEVADVVYLVWKSNHEFISSVRHIVNVWRWNHVINICMEALGKICADVPDDDPAVELLEETYDMYCTDEATRYGCFEGILTSKKNAMIPDILTMVNSLRGSDSDKILGNLFKRMFFVNFPDYRSQFNPDMFAGSSSYTRQLVKGMAGGSDKGSFVERYREAKTRPERDQLIREAITKVRAGNSAGVYDAVRMLRNIDDTSVKEEMYQLLKLNEKAGREKKLLPVISYFSSVGYAPADNAMKAVSRENEYYSACQAALFKRGIISGDEIMRLFLSEERRKQLENYLNGLYDVNVQDIRTGAFRYFSSGLTDEQLSLAIYNYEALVKRYKHLYNPQIGDLILTYFGYKTASGKVRIRMAEQNLCLNIIGMIINSANYGKYEDFLYYVAEQSMFNTTIASHAREILSNMNNDRIKI